MANPRRREAQGQLLCACSPCGGNGLIAEGEYYWQYVGNYIVPFNICWSCYHLEERPHQRPWTTRARFTPANSDAHPDAS